MRVNSAFAGFFTNRLVVGSVIAIMMFGVFFTASSFTEHSERDLRAKQVNLIIRQIGDRLLLQAGDSTSRVMPVTEDKEGVFLLKFENEFVFNHDSLMALSHDLLPKTQFASGYTVTVHDCTKGSIVYGFQVSNTSPDILACRGRIQPTGCYTIEFAFPDFYANVKPKKVGIDPQRTESDKADRREANPKPEESKTTTSDNDIDQRTESVKADPQEVNPKLEAFKKATFDDPLINVVYGGVLLLLGVTLLIGRFGKILKPVPGQDQNQAIIQSHAIINESVPESAAPKESVQELSVKEYVPELPSKEAVPEVVAKEFVPEFPALGNFLFNVKGQRLLLGSEVISLTDKECKVLELLHKNFGELIPRETLMQEVWINEGVITGRSLDMFVSKLRKKLSSDPELRITNVHGKGYKLEIPEG